MAKKDTPAGKGLSRRQFIGGGAALTFGRGLGAAATVYGQAAPQALAADDRQRYIAYTYVAYLLSQPAFTGYAWHLTGRGDVASGLWLRIRRAGPR